MDKRQESPVVIITCDNSRVPEKRIWVLQQPPRPKKPGFKGSHTFTAELQNCQLPMPAALWHMTASRLPWTTTWNPVTNGGTTLLRARRLLLHGCHDRKGNWKTLKSTAAWEPKQEPPPPWNTAGCLWQPSVRTGWLQTRIGPFVKASKCRGSQKWTQISGVQETHGEKPQRRFPPLAALRCFPCKKEGRGEGQ